MKTRGFKVLFASELREQNWTNTALLHYGSVVQCMCKNDKKSRNSFHVKCTCSEIPGLTIMNPGISSYQQLYIQVKITIKENMGNRFLYKKNALGHIYKRSHARSLVCK